MLVGVKSNRDRSRAVLMPNEILRDGLEMRMTGMSGSSGVVERYDDMKCLMGECGSRQRQNRGNHERELLQTIVAVDGVRLRRSDDLTI
jgi:hypothetical protein